MKEAKEQHSQLIEEALSDGYQIINKNNESAVVVISKVDFDKLDNPTQSLVDFFKKAPCTEVELDLDRSSLI